jgi:hypothetical protein
MTNAPESSANDDQSSGIRSEVSEADGPVNGADAVPDKTADTPAKGAGFDQDDEADGTHGDPTPSDTATDATNDPRGDKSIRDQ